MFLLNTLLLGVGLQYGREMKVTVSEIIEVYVICAKIKSSSESH